MDLRTYWAIVSAKDPDETTSLSVVTIAIYGTRPPPPNVRLQDGSDETGSSYHPSRVGVLGPEVVLSVKITRVHDFIGMDVKTQRIATRSSNRLPDRNSEFEKTVSAPREILLVNVLQGS